MSVLFEVNGERHTFKKRGRKWIGKCFDPMCHGKIKVKRATGEYRCTHCRIQGRANIQRKASNAA